MVPMATRIVDKPWGRTGIDARFNAPRDRQIGEIWFEPPEGRTIDTMAKYLFTTERLSVQVHPNEETAHARGLRHGKDECWIVVDAEPDAELGIGTVRELSADDLLAAARDGSIEALIDWRKARRGQFIYNPAGTVHALGPGLTVLEIQQSADVTYRLYDYGRPRELHLEESRKVVKPAPHLNAADRDDVFGDSQVLVDGPFFGVAWCAGRAPQIAGAPRDMQLLPVDVAMVANGRELHPGQCALIDFDPAELSSGGAFVLAWTCGYSRSGRE